MEVCPRVDEVGRETSPHADLRSGRIHGSGRPAGAMAEDGTTGAQGVGMITASHPLIRVLASRRGSQPSTPFSAAGSQSAPCRRCVWSRERQILYTRGDRVFMSSTRGRADWSLGKLSASSWWGKITQASSLVTFIPSRLHQRGGCSVRVHHTHAT